MSHTTYDALASARVFLEAFDEVRCPFEDEGGNRCSRDRGHNEDELPHIPSMSSADLVVRRLRALARTLGEKERGRSPMLVEQVNASPEPLRSYIYELETRADPTGTVQELFSTREQLEGLLLKLQVSEKEHKPEDREIVERAQEIFDRAGAPHDFDDELEQRLVSSIAHALAHERNAARQVTQ